MHFSKKNIWELVGAGLELFGAVGGLISLVAGAMPDKSKDEEVKEITVDENK